jgi:RHS repeat-associated protein
VVERILGKAEVRSSILRGSTSRFAAFVNSHSGTADRRFLHADERGNIIAISNASGAVSAVNTYDEYGIPATTNMGRFGYTGQAWLPEIGLNYYKARIYSPTLGRFMQSDPIGYGDGVNFYDYVGGDPVNGRDPSGLVGDDIVVTAPSNAATFFDFGNNPYDQYGLNGYEAELREQDASNRYGIAQDSCNRAGGTFSGDYSGTTCELQEARASKISKFIQWLTSKLIAKTIANVSPKISKQMAARGWNQSKIDQTLNAGVTGRAKNRATGNSASVYGDKQGYIVVDDITRDIIQISDRKSLDWLPDPSIIFF